jgi:cytochrome c-type biogenesis protein CcmH/NrfG
MKKKLFCLLLACFGFQTIAKPQSSNGRTPESSSDIGKSAKIGSLSNQARSGDVLIGIVSVATGSLPWDPIPVAVSCDGKLRYTTQADPKGRFEIATVETSSYTLGTEGAKAKPASKFIGCTVEAALAGFDSSTLTIGNRNILDTTDIGTITLTREEGAAGAESATTASAPKDAMKAFERARAEWQDQKPDKAQKDLEKAVQLDPQFAEAWYQLGKMQEPTNPKDAGTSYAKAVAADPKFIAPYQHLAPLAAQAGQWQELADATGHELQLDPRGTAQIWYFQALANYKLGKRDVAKTSAEKALAMDPVHTEPNTEQLLAVILADNRDYAGALEHLRNSLTYLPNGANTELVKQQIAQLEKMVPAK